MEVIVMEVIAQPSEQTCRIPHTILYYPHGDVILESALSVANAPAKSFSTLFRVHRWLLAHRSSMFRDMFSFPYLPAGGEADEFIDEIPVIQTTDAAEDLESVLRVLYYPTYVSFNCDFYIPVKPSFGFILNSDLPRCTRFDPDTPIKVSSALRIARKYDFEALGTYLEKLVLDDWPVTLEAYDHLEAELLEIHKRWEKGRCGGKRYADLFPEPLAAIAFAREFDCPQILPAAYYALANLELTDEWDSQYKRKLLARWSLADELDLERISRGRSELLVVTTSMMDDGFASLMSLTDSECRAYPPNACQVILRQLFEAIWEKPDSGHDQLDLLHRCFNYWKYLSAHAFESNDVTALCHNRDAAMRRWVVRERKALWERLPDYFQLK